LVSFAGGLRRFSASASETSRPKERRRSLEPMECLVQAMGLGRSEAGFRCRCPGRRHRLGCLQDWQTQELRGTKSRKTGIELSFEDTSRRKLAFARNQNILLKRRQAPCTLIKQLPQKILLTFCLMVNTWCGPICARIPAKTAKQPDPANASSGTVRAVCACS
jgi:hypothetical protein